MNVEIGTVAAQFLFWDYLFRIFGIGSLQCVHHGWLLEQLSGSQTAFETTLESQAAIGTPEQAS